MPHWDPEGREEWVCQKGTHVCTGNSVWVRKLGNVCPACLDKDRMTGKGKILRLFNSEEYEVFATGAHVLLAGGTRCGRVHSWTRYGVMVRLCLRTEHADTLERPTFDGQIVAAFDCGDGDISALLESPS